MTTLHPDMAADLNGSAVLMFCAVEVVLPSAAVRLLDGAGTVTFSDRTFVGLDAVYGTLGGITEVGDGLDSEAPSLTLTLLPKTNAAMVAFAAPEAQGSPVRIWVGDLDPATGLVIGTPELWFTGETDVATQKVGRNSRVLSVTVNSVFFRFLEADQGARLNNGFHQLIHPGELGLQYVTRVGHRDPWGSDTPRPPVTYAAPPAN